MDLIIRSVQLADQPPGHLLDIGVEHGVIMPPV
jgi:hypothetical protein